MDNLDASTETYENSVSVIKSFTPDFRTIYDAGQLRPLPYVLEIKRGIKTRGLIKKRVYNKNTYSIDFADGVTKVVHKVPAKSWSPVLNSGYSYATSRSIRDVFGDPILWPECTTALAKMQNGLLAKVQGQSLPVLMALKERKQTASLIRDTVQRLYNGARLIRHPRKMFKALRGRGPSAIELRRLRRIERRLLKRRLRENKSSTFGEFHIEQAFLEYRFAWLPLIKDCQDMLDGMDKALKKGISKSARKGISFSLSKAPELKYFANQVDPGAISDSSVSIVGHMKVFYAIDNASLALFSQCQGVAATIWDGVPYSFLFDGLVNISKYLDLLDATMGVKFLDGYVVTLSRSACNANNGSWFRSSSAGKLDGSDGAVLYKYDDIQGTSIHLKMIRQILSDFPPPVLEYPYRDFVTVQRVADIAALAIQFGRRIF